MGLVYPIQDRLPHGSTPGYLLLLRNSPYGSRAYMDVFTRVLNWVYQPHVRGTCDNLQRIYHTGFRN